jgi:23S rRNA (adenine2503-C2)-methyltransferase
VSGEKIDLKGLDLDGMRRLVAELTEPRFRADQIASWVFEKDVSSFDEMTNLSKALRARLSEIATVTRAEVADARRSSDGTEKVLLRYAGGDEVEAVTLRDGDRTTGCISTQIGCRFGCTFCATGAMGLVRDLTAGEIVEEIAALQRRAAPGRIGNLVFMGMGEPLDNYDATMHAIRIANASWGLGIGARHITVSTAGLVPGIRRLAHEGLQINLAVSLNAPTQDLRARIMPVAEAHPLDELVPALADYAHETGRMITIEYILLKDLNDTPEAADRLSEIARAFPCKVNLICYNETEHAPFLPPTDAAAERFLLRLRERCPTVVRRVSRGGDIGAACGQLRVEREKPA